MPDLRTLLHDAAGPADATTSGATADADLFRARRALRRRRAGRLSAGSGLVAAAAIGAFAIVGPTSAPAHHDRAVPDKPSAVALVSYTSKQPAGFVLDKIPAGWAIRDNDPGVLTIAPEGSHADESPGAPTSFVGTIAIMTERDTGVPTGVKLDEVTVADEPAVIAHMRGAGDTRTLFQRQPSGAYLVIQVWDGLGWDNARIAEFAASVHVTKDAQLSVG